MNFQFIFSQLWKVKILCVWKHLLSIIIYLSSRKNYVCPIILILSRPKLIVYIWFGLYVSSLSSLKVYLAFVCAHLPVFLITYTLFSQKIIAPCFRKVVGQVPDGCLLVPCFCGFAGCIMEAYSSLLWVVFPVGCWVPVFKEWIVPRVMFLQWGIYIPGAHGDDCASVIWLCCIILCYIPAWGG